MNQGLQAGLRDDLLMQVSLKRGLQLCSPDIFSFPIALWEVPHNSVFSYPSLMTPVNLNGLFLVLYSYFCHSILYFHPPS